MIDDELDRPEPGGIFRNPESVEVATVHGNTAQELVLITVDRLRLRLVEHSDTIRRRNSWLAPVGIFVPVLVALLTAEFQHVVFSPHTWKAVFIIVGALSFGWLLYELWRTWHAPSMDDLIEKIKNSNGP